MRQTPARGLALRLCICNLLIVGNILPPVLGFFPCLWCASCSIWAMEHTERAKALENLSTAVALLDAQLCVLYLNPAAEALLETSSGRAQGFGLTKLMPHSERFIEDLRAAMRSAH